MTNETLEVLKTRRAVRKFLPQQVEREKLDAILEAGTFAPTAIGRQPVKIIALQDPEAVAAADELNRIVRGGDMRPYYGAPTIILVLVTDDSYTPELDGAAACTNMLNAARSLGLGSCWIHRCGGMFELPEGKALLKKWGFTEHLTGIASIALGYTDGEEPAPAPRKEGIVTVI